MSRPVLFRERRIVWAAVGLTLLGPPERAQHHKHVLLVVVVAVVLVVVVAAVAVVAVVVGVVVVVAVVSLALDVELLLLRLLPLQSLL